MTKGFLSAVAGFAALALLGACATIAAESQAVEHCRRTLGKMIKGGDFFRFGSQGVSSFVVGDRRYTVVRINYLLNNVPQTMTCRYERGVRPVRASGINDRGRELPPDEVDRLNKDDPS